MKYIEHGYQIQTVAWFRLQYPHMPKTLIMINNGTATNPKTGARLKSMGLVAGAFDLFLAYPHPKTRCPGLWLEMKTETGIVSKPQAEFREEMEDRGYQCKVARSFELAKGFIEDYIKNG